MTSTRPANAIALPKPIPAWLDFAMYVSLIGLVGTAWFGTLVVLFP